MTGDGRRERKPCDKCKTAMVFGRCCMACNARIGVLRDRESKGTLTPEDAEELRLFPRLANVRADAGCSAETASKIVQLLQDGGRCGQRGGVDSFRLMQASGMTFSAFGTEKVAPDRYTMKGGKEYRTDADSFARKLKDERTQPPPTRIRRKQLIRPDGKPHFEDYLHG